MTLGHHLLQVTQILFCYNSNPVEVHGSREKNVTLLITIYNFEPNCLNKLPQYHLDHSFVSLYENCCMWKFQRDCIFCKMTEPKPERTVVLRCAVPCLQNYPLQISTFEWPETAELQFFAVLCKYQKMWGSVDASRCFTRSGLAGRFVAVLFILSEQQLKQQTSLCDWAQLYLQYPSDRREKQSEPQWGRDHQEVTE